MKKDKSARELLAAVGATTLILGSSLPAVGGEPAQNPGTTPSAAEVGSRAGKKCAGMGVASPAEVGSLAGKKCAGMGVASPAEVGSLAGKKCAGMLVGIKCGSEVLAAKTAPAPYLQGRERR